MKKLIQLSGFISPGSGAYLELQATPAIFYMDDKGERQQQQGAPSPDKLAKILGPK